MTEESKLLCFIIGPIGGEGSKERTRSDNVQKYLIRPAVNRYFDVIRADQLPQPGSITHQVIKLLYEADLVIAD